MKRIRTTQALLVLLAAVGMGLSGPRRTILLMLLVVAVLLLDSVARELKAHPRPYLLFEGKKIRFTVVQDGKGIYHQTEDSPLNFRAWKRWEKIGDFTIPRKDHPSPRQVQSEMRFNGETIPVTLQTMVISCPCTEFHWGGTFAFCNFRTEEWEGVLSFFKIIGTGGFTVTRKEEPDCQWREYSPPETVVTPVTISTVR